MNYPILILGLGLIGLGLRLMYQRITFLLRSQKAYGRLDQWNESRKMNSQMVYYFAEVVFKTSDGTEHHVASEYGSGSYVGQKPKFPREIPVRYDPKNPEDAHICTLFNFWGPTLISLFFGGAITFGIFRQWRGRK